MKVNPDVGLNSLCVPVPGVALTRPDPARIHKLGMSPSRRLSSNSPKCSKFATWKLPRASKTVLALVQVRLSVWDSTGHMASRAMHTGKQAFSASIPSHTTSLGPKALSGAQLPSEDRHPSHPPWSTLSVGSWLTLRKVVN